MKDAPTLAVMLAPRLDPGVEAFLRLCVGVVAGGRRLTLLEVGAGRGVLAPEHAASEESERCLTSLADFGITPHGVGAEELGDLLRGCERILRVADPARAGEPALLVVDDAWLAATEPADVLQALERAGQVVRS